MTRDNVQQAERDDSDLDAHDDASAPIVVKVAARCSKIATRSPDSRVLCRTRTARSPTHSSWCTAAAVRSIDTSIDSASRRRAARAFA